ncbi:MAG TPA: substrate-binding domain-containing protein [Microbacterium sp.]|uniref:LacI family DNA-binding transcriptional regulator n=1 Tax=Microbacterium sp. TaxID=51671 RepID=UPI002C793AB0|nr:substrate-binding domain-containing protein [Microbacterium sp.]HWI30775.1 substrate-binding domain-containing protein [Microbacterium sp.]
MSEAPSTRRVGVRDVARLAGVSTQTVSRVLNDYPGIRAETRDRVREAVAALDYRMNNTARSFGTSTTRTLGLIASNATLYGPSIAIEALEAAARSVGRWVATVYADAADEESVDAAARHLVSHGVDGIVVLATHARTVAAASSAAPGVPVAALHAGPGAERQSEGAELAVRHLVDLGHRRIARVAGPSHWFEASAREAGVVRALPEAGLRWEGDWSAASGAALAAEVAAAVRAPGGPTAVAVANDQMALGLMAGLHGAGVDAPRDVSITGFDDNPDAAFYSPALTTVRLDIVGEARRAVGEVLGLADPELAPGPARLIVRASTGRAD